MIRSSAILIIAFCAAYLLKRRSAAERHIVWAAAIISSALLPLLSVLLPSWQPELAQRVAAALPAMPQTGANAGLSHGAGVIFSSNGIEPTMTALNRNWSVMWFAGSILGLLVLALGTLRQRRFASHSHRLSDPVLDGISSDLSRRLGCKRTIYLRQSENESMPMTWGFLRPQVLLPKCVDSWSDERKRIVLAHEFAHVHRLDWLFQILAQLACAVYWFNPLFWIACNRLHRESEHAADDTVIRFGVDARNYASHLLEIARVVTHSDRLWSAALAMARPSTLEKRFFALLNPGLNRRDATRKTLFSVTLGMFCIVVPLATLRFPAAIPVFDASSSPPKVDQYTTPPLYSDEGRRRGIEGVVTVELAIRIDGSVERLRVVKGLGYGLDQNALLAVRDWRFVPARRNGSPIEATTQIGVEFNLRNAELNELIANDMATRIGPGVTPPQVVHTVEPRYSDTRNKPAGAVVLDAVILEDGTPKVVRVIRSLDWELDEIAINALKQWRFSPAMKDGRPVKVRMNVAVNFSST